MVLIGNSDMDVPIRSHGIIVEEMLALGLDLMVEAVKEKKVLYLLI